MTWWARTVVTVWVLLVVPLLLLSLVLRVVSLPRAAATAWESVGQQWDVLTRAWSDGESTEVGVRVLSILALALPVLPMVYLLVRVLRRTVRNVARSTQGRPVRRAVAVATAMALLAGLALAWWPGDGTYRPIRPSERGTLLDAVPAAVADRVPLLQRARTAVPSTPSLKEGQTGAAQTLWASDETPPPKDQPQLAMVLVPTEAAPQGAAGALEAPTEAPTWVFPFNKPDAPEAGDNQALAVNTSDGTIRYDVAFALVWADDGEVLNTNEAYAFASCNGCAAVAIGFQVILVLGQADVVIPQNLAAAVNYNCLECATYALAQQLVLTLDGPLSEAGKAAIEAVWAQIQQYGASIGQVPIGQIQATLADIEKQIVDIVEAESSGESPTASPPPTPAPSDAPAAGSLSDAPSGSSSAVPAPSDQPSTSGSPEPSSSPTPTDTATDTTSPTPTETTTP